MRILRRLRRMSAEGSLLLRRRLREDPTCVVKDLLRR